MAMRVVDGFEMVEVDEDDRKFVAVTVRAVDFRVQHEVQMARVVERGAVVSDSEFVNALDVARVFDGDGRVVGKGLEQREFARAETFVADAVDEFDDAEALVAKTHWHGD